MTEPALIIDPKNETPRQRRLRHMTRQRYSANKVLLISTYRFPSKAHDQLSDALREEGLTMKDVIWESLRNACLQRGIECTLNIVKRGPVPISAKVILSQERVCHDAETALSAKRVNESDPISINEIFDPRTGKRQNYKDYLNKILNNTQD